MQTRKVEKNKDQKKTASYFAFALNFTSFGKLSEEEEETLFSLKANLLFCSLRWLSLQFTRHRPNKASFCQRKKCHAYFQSFSYFNAKSLPRKKAQNIEKLPKKELDILFINVRKTNRRRFWQAFKARYILSVKRMNG